VLIGNQSILDTFHHKTDSLAGSVRTRCELSLLFRRSFLSDRKSTIHSPCSLNLNPIGCLQHGAGASEEREHCVLRPWTEQDVSAAMGNIHDGTPVRKGSGRSPPKTLRDHDEGKTKPHGEARNMQRLSPEAVLVARIQLWADIACKISISGPMDRTQPD